MTTAAFEIAEHRVILSNISWQTFEQLLAELGKNRCTRLAYNDGVLEIMTPVSELGERTATRLEIKCDREYLMVKSCFVILSSCRVG